MNRLNLLCCLGVLWFAGPAAFAQNLPLVPPPAQLSVADGKTMAVPGVMLVSAPDDAAWRQHLEIAGQRLAEMTQGKHRLSLVDTDGAMMEVVRDASLAAEAYSLEIKDEKISLTASSLKGLAHGTATLLQLLGGHSPQAIPQLLIQDAPQVSYRNFMVDMGRNPHSVELLKETIDLLWFYKIDSLQLHLTDDQRFAFPSTAYPKLWDGLITVEQFRELEAYAVARGVTIIPELEVPGHSSILRNQYPEVFGKTGTDLVSSETALQGIQTLLDEMLDVFSSTPYIHIGGDEAFGVPEDLQRELINKLHAYLKSQGKQTLVWEGPRPGTGDNKVNPEVIHINWRTINYPADQMLKDGYRVVNAAWDPLYLVDHYPRTNFTMASPQHIYETLALTRFKHFNPGIQTFARPIEVEPTERLIGFCMPWWEGREENYFPQVVPRLIAFAEVAWSPGVEREYAKLVERVGTTETARAAAFYPVTINASDMVIPADGVFHDQTIVVLQSDVAGDIRYTLDGSQPTATSPKYEQPLVLAESTTVRAAVFAAGKQLGHGSRENFTAVTPVDNLALGKPVTSSVPSGSPFSVQRITDGGTDNLGFYLGYPAEPEPIALTIDLEQAQPVRSVTVIAYTVSGSYEKYTVEVSADGETYQQVATRLDKPAQPTAVVEHKFDSRDVRFVRILSHGNKGYVFDSFSKIVEVQVR